MKHDYKRKNGKIDMLAWESDYHSGPICIDCREPVCEWCEEDYLNLECKNHENQLALFDKREYTR